MSINNIKWINNIFNKYSNNEIKQFLSNKYPEHPVVNNSNIKNIFKEYYKCLI